MTFSIDIKDYQAIKRVTIDMEDGLTILTGDTNQGKSSTMRAIYAALFNKGSDGDVRVGHRYAGVMINNGKNRFMWRRDSHGKNDKTEYKIDNDKPITKVGRVQLDEIASLFNITDVRMANNNKEILNFWFQEDSPFLTKKTDGQLFEFLSISSHDEYLRVLKEMKGDISGYEGSINKLNATIDVLKQANQEKDMFIKANAGFDELYTAIIVHNEEVKKMVKVEEMINHIAAGNTRIKLKREELGNIEQLLGTVDIVAVGEEWQLLQDKAEFVDKVGKMLADIEARSNTLEQKKGELQRLEVSFNTYSGYLKDLKTDIESLETIDTQLVSVYDQLVGIRGKMDTKQRLELNLKFINKSLEGIDLDSVAKEIVNLGNIQQWCQIVGPALVGVQDRNIHFKKKQEDFNAICNDLSTKQAEFDAFKAEIGACPYCGSSFGGENHEC